MPSLQIMLNGWQECRLNHDEIVGTPFWASAQTTKLPQRGYERIHLSATGNRQ